VNRAPYTALDFQLLVELRLGLIEGALLPISTLRILRERGWVKVPTCEEWAYVEAEPDEDDESTASLPPTDFAVASVQLTELGERELTLFSKRFSDVDVYGVLAEDQGVDLDDDACDDDG
jgi:hypothetical protein